MVRPRIFSKLAEKERAVKQLNYGVSTAAGAGRTSLAGTYGTYRSSMGHERPRLRQSYGVQVFYILYGKRIPALLESHSSCCYDSYGIAGLVRKEFIPRFLSFAGYTYICDWLLGERLLLAQR